MRLLSCGLRWIVCRAAAAAVAVASKPNKLLFVLLVLMLCVHVRAAMRNENEWSMNYEITAKFFFSLHSFFSFFCLPFCPFQCFTEVFPFKTRISHTYTLYAYARFTFFSSLFCVHHLSPRWTLSGFLFQFLFAFVAFKWSIFWLLLSLNYLLFFVKFLPSLHCDDCDSEAVYVL